MKEYSIFWVKEEFAEHYFYKSDILYRFLKSYQENKDREDLEIQYQYIMNNFPPLMISHIIKHQKNISFIKMNEHQIEIHNNINYMTLHIHEKQIKFLCESIHVAEALLFPSLRLFHPFLFIVGDNFKDFGWISPVTTKVKNKKREQVLYSQL